MNLRQLTAHGSVALVLSAAASAQSTQAVLHGSGPGERFGEHFAAVGDLDADGVEDLVMGFPEDDTAATDAGRVDVVSGVDGSLLMRFYGDEPGDRAGFSVARVGDVDLDGLPDVLFGAPSAEGGKGVGQVRSGADGTLLFYLRGLAAWDQVSYALAGPGDVNGDGHADVAVGAPGVDIGSSDMGRVYFVSGADGSVLHVIDGLYPQIRFGQVLSDVGDATGDGVPDLLAGTPDFSGKVGGYMQLISGADGSVVRSHVGDVFAHTYNLTGHFAGGVGDLDGDQVSDYAVLWEPAFGSTWEFVLHSGATGAGLGVFGSGHWRQHRFVDAGDLDGDGVHDQVFGPVNDFGDFLVRSGATGDVVDSITWPDPQDDFGARIANVGDRDGDGRSEVAVGAPADATNGADAGAIAVFGVPPCGGVRVSCGATVNSTGASARLFWSGSGSVSANDMRFEAHFLPPSSSGLMIYSPGLQVSVLGNGYLCLDPAPLGFILRLPPTASDSGGVLTHDLDVTSPPAPVGLITPGSRWYFQCWFRDLAAGGAMFDFSDTVRVDFCP